jgi:hypothetical protein
MIGKSIICGVLIAVLIFCKSRTNTLFSPRQVNILPSAQFVKTVSLGFDDVLADMYWLAFIQYLGSNSQYPEAEKYLQIVVALDPHFVKAYYFAAFVIGSEQHEPEVADSFIRAGFKSNSNDWTLPFLAGVNQFLYAKNETKAAEYYRQAAKLPGAPEWLARQSDILEARIPSIIKSINVWDTILNTASDVEVKERAKNNLLSLWTRVSRTAPTQLIRARASAAIQKLESIP